MCQLNAILGKQVKEEQESGNSPRPELSQCRTGAAFIY